MCAWNLVGLGERKGENGEISRLEKKKIIIIIMKSVCSQISYSEPMDYKGERGGEGGRGGGGEVSGQVKSNLF